LDKSFGEGDHVTTEEKKSKKLLRKLNRLNGSTAQEMKKK